MSIRRSAMTGTVLASISAATLLGATFSANAQPYDQYQDQGQQGYQGDQGGYQQGYDQDQGPPPGYNAAPPEGQYAPPPPGGGAGYYDNRSQQYDQEYAARYSDWAARNCVDRRNTNTAAGAIIGGVLGAVIGSNVAGRGDRGAGTVVGGVLGAGAGAAIGNASTDSRGCPPGYIVRAGAPGFYYGGGPDYGPGYWGPSWYNPWVWSGGRYVYTPYRRWYYGHPTYWRGRRHYR